MGSGPSKFENESVIEDEHYNYTEDYITWIKEHIRTLVGSEGHTFFAPKEKSTFMTHGAIVEDAQYFLLGPVYKRGTQVYVARSKHFDNLKECEEYMSSINYALNSIQVSSEKVIVRFSDLGEKEE